ncbi:hypothetical protein DESUT3_31570 [Desulfuromonas versatilis]|uniref:DUF5666 domain-containing protein n=1 Tax=Desulfuromonas versatilis TaxID=2802975 RepID=A0ABM8HZ93_9BACT|nr:hypothetical protein [Desulfuromonas versatilis]BCR06088.1 hypothetical protein DESUT3_31570 [Desulfuromonas versatilis]
MKKMIAVLAATLLVASFAGVALSKGTTVTGKVTAVNGDVVTVEVEKGKAEAIAVGAEVEMEVKEQKKAPKKGMDMLQGC